MTVHTRIWLSIILKVQFKHIRNKIRYCSVDILFWYIFNHFAETFSSEWFSARCTRKRQLYFDWFNELLQVFSVRETRKCKTCFYFFVFFSRKISINGRLPLYTQLYLCIKVIIQLLLMVIILFKIFILLTTTVTLVRLVRTKIILSTPWVSYISLLL